MTNSEKNSHIAKLAGLDAVVSGVKDTTATNACESKSATSFFSGGNLPNVVIYTDGACSGNPGPGGWGVLLKFDNISKEISGYELDTTNNRMEIIAAIEGLRVLKRRCNVELYTDSKYLQQGISTWIHSWLANNWRKANKEPVKNVDLWQDLYAEIEKHKIIWKWVKAHNNNVGNEIADRLAVSAKEDAIKILKSRLKI